jgi:hypothetical protein
MRVRLITMPVIYNPWSRRPRYPITVGMIVNWARNLDSAIDQITKAYEWRIGQWSGFGGAILTSILGFVSAVAVSSFKDNFLPLSWWRIVVVIVGLLAAIVSYFIAQQMISRIREEYLQLYGLLQLLRSKP